MQNTNIDIVIFSY